MWIQRVVGIRPDVRLALLIYGKSRNSDAPGRNAPAIAIEETMDVVRREMALLTEVDQPGSMIDKYVEKLEMILNQKMEKIVDLKGKLGRFKEHLKEEELMSKTLGPAGARKW
eukprot:1157220-Pelagomonas_calceolata.AAC.1